MAIASYNKDNTLFFIRMCAAGQSEYFPAMLHNVARRGQQFTNFDRTILVNSNGDVFVSSNYKSCCSDIPPIVQIKPINMPVLWRAS